jgi:hypothetical protein
MEGHLGPFIKKSKLLIWLEAHNFYQNFNMARDKNGHNQVSVDEPTSVKKIDITMLAKD